MAFTLQPIEAGCMDVTAKLAARRIRSHGFAIAPSFLSEKQLHEIEEAFLAATNRWSGRGHNRFSCIADENSSGWEHLTSNQMITLVLQELADQTGFPYCIGKSGGDMVMPGALREPLGTCMGGY